MGRVDIRLVFRGFGCYFQFAFTRWSVIRVCTSRVVTSNFRRRNYCCEAICASKGYRWCFLITCLTTSRFGLIVSGIYRVPIDLYLTNVGGGQLCDVLCYFRVVHRLKGLRFTAYFIVANDRCKSPYFMGLKGRIGVRSIGCVIKATVSGSALCVKRYYRLDNYSVIQMGFAVCARDAGNSNGRNIFNTSRVRSGGRVLFRSIVLFLDC